MRRILWAAILIPLLVLGVAAAVIASVSIGGNVKILNVSLVSNTSLIQWGTLCLSCVPANSTSTRSFSLTNNGQVGLTLGYTIQCPSGLTIFLGEGNTNLNGVLLAAGQTISAVNATLFVSGTPPAPGPYSCGVLITGSG